MGGASDDGSIWVAPVILQSGKARIIEGEEPAGLVAGVDIDVAK
jgi:hypothetical protein